MDAQPFFFMQKILEYSCWIFRIQLIGRKNIIFKMMNLFCISKNYFEKLAVKGLDFCANEESKS